MDGHGRKELEKNSNDIEIYYPDILNQILLLQYYCLYPEFKQMNKKTQMQWFLEWKFFALLDWKNISIVCISISAIQARSCPWQLRYLKLVVQTSCSAQLLQLFT